MTSAPRARAILHRAQADWPGADDERGFARLDGGAAGGMSADAKHFDQGKLLRRHVVGFVQLVDGDRQPFAHAAVDVDAEDLQALAAVGAAATAGDAGAAVEVGLDGAAVADGEVVLEIGRTQREDFDGQLVAEDARVGEEGLVALVGVQVGAADAHAQDADEGLAGTGFGRRFGVRELEGEWLLQNDGFHDDCSSLIAACRG